MTMIQIPLLIAIFNVLGELQYLEAQSFLWINNLSLPDEIGKLPFSIMLFGDSISLLPFVMLVLGCVAAYFYKNKVLSQSALRNQKLKLYLLAIIFFLLFYPFPAAMLLYWITINFIVFVQKQVLH